jgi:hypothetical protein
MKRDIVRVLIGIPVLVAIVAAIWAIGYYGCGKWVLVRLDNSLGEKLIAGLFGAAMIVLAGVVVIGAFFVAFSLGCWLLEISWWRGPKRV